MREKSAVRPLRRTGAVLAAALIATILPAGVAHAASDLHVEKADSSNTVFAGQNLNYTITAENQGTDPATAVTITDRLPAGLDFLSVQVTPSGAGNCDRQGRLITCQLGTLMPDETNVITIRTRVTRKQPGTLENTAEGTTTAVGDTPANNSDTELTTVTKAPQNDVPRCMGARATIVRGNGDNTIFGTSGRDVILAGGGDDSVFAGDGRDLVCLGPGFDLGSGGAKADAIAGGLNADRLRGKRGDDVLRGKQGPDRLRGGRGDDFLGGGRGFDFCRGGPGVDLLRSCNP
jgi:uncharacterized repeat protein (TIGR01451 family)